VGALEAHARSRIQDARFGRCKESAGVALHLASRIRTLNNATKHAAGFKGLSLHPWREMKG